MAIRWSGDAFLLVQAAGELDDAHELLGRPIVIKGSDEPVRLDLGVAMTTDRMPIDKLVARAEAGLFAARDVRQRP